MHLKSLTLRGFKSFADKTELSFHPGLIAIVGPNGSGKSNISDAVLWVLGEQSARHLRGSSMEDVIFAGSHSRPALGLAEVLLTLDNSDGSIPLEYTEVTIGRRLYRSGESEYLLNGTPCRLLDIQECLSDAGLGRGLYSVISQGRIDEVLSSRSEDRRSLIDEAAGLLKHRRRKERTIRKLEKVDQNLVRAHDIHNEVKRQLGPLKRQAEAARVAQELQDSLKQLQIQSSISELKILQTSWEQAGKSEEQLASEHSSLKQAVEASGSVLSQTRKELEELLTGSGSGASERERLIRLVERLSAEQRHAEQRRSRLSHQKHEIENSRIEIASKIEECNAIIAGIESDDALTMKCEAAETKLKEAQQALAESRRQSEATSASEREIERRQAELRHAKALHASEIESFRQQITEIDALLSKNDQSTKDEQDRLRALEHALENLQGSALKEKEDQINDAQDAAQRAESRQNSLLGEVAELRVAESAAREELARLEGEEATLSKMIVDNRLLEPGRLPTGASDGVVGYLSEVLNVSPEHEKAIESLLRETTASIVIKEASFALDVVSAAEGAGGGLVMLALNLLEEVDSASHPALTSEFSSAAFPISELVDIHTGIDQETARRLKGLFARDFLVTSLEEAIKEAVKAPHLRFVTKDGNMVGPGAVISIAGGDKNGDGALRLERLLRETKSARKKSASKLIRIEGERAELEKTTASAASASGEASDALRLRKTEWTKIHSEINETVVRLNASRSLVTTFSTERDRLAGRLSSLQEGEKASTAAITECSKTLDQADAEIVLLSKQREAAVAAQRSAEEQVQRVQSTFYETAEVATQARRNRDSATADLRRLTAEQMKLHDRLGKITAAEQSLPELVIMLDKLTVIAESELGSLDRIRAGKNAIIEEKRKQLSERESEHRRLRHEIEARNNSIHRIELQKASLQAKVEGAVRYLTEELCTPIDAAMRLPDLVIPIDEAKEQIRRLKSRLATLGPINPVAVEEFASLEQRNTFLEEQLGDLKESKEGILAAIAELDTYILDLFSATFEKASNHFAEIFSLLFPGSRAMLVLTNEDDLLNSGVDIEVKMAGRKFQKLSLLSGGERALSALAFTFALYATRPTPFCILDEVDAALDDFNISRFVELIERFRERSQFFIVTHQKRTMNSADIIYGVSMEPSGITTLVSQKIAPDKRVAGAPAQMKTTDRVEAMPLTLND